MRRVARALVRPSLLARFVLAPAACAQAPVATWTMEQAADLSCVSCLVEPRLARTLAGSRFMPVAAERVDGPHPAVAQLVAGEPDFRAWVPA